MTTETDLALLHTLLPARPADAHKGTFGHVFIIAGSRGFTGAAKLACLGAGRSGTGLVTVGLPRPLGDIVATSLTEAMSFMLDATDGESIAESALEPALDFAATKDAVVLGPGLSQNEETRAFVLEFVRRCPAPMLIDADALNALSFQPVALATRKSPCVITPHPGEMGRLLGKTPQEVQASRERIAADTARRFDCTVVLKGHRTVVANADGKLMVNPTGNNGLAKGGTGDVLAGLIGGLLAQRMEGFPAALLGAYLHGLAGDIAARQKTRRAMTASDVVDCIPAAWQLVEPEACT